MRLSATLLCLGLAVALLSGCGSGGSTTEAPPGAGNAAKPQGGATTEARARWEARPACTRPDGASRWGCSVGPYRCQAVVVDRGWAVDCAKPGRSISFTIPPRKQPAGSGGP